MKGKVIGGSAAAVLALAAAFIAPWESKGGKPDLVPYRDIVGVWTDCIGNTHNVIPGRIRTEAECAAIFRSDLGRRLNALDQCITKPLRVGEWVSVLSLSYNVGTTAVCKSTLVRKINAGAGPEEFCPELRKWSRAGGKVVKGLVNRREAELKLCLEG